MTVLDDAIPFFEQLLGNPSVQDDLDRWFARAGRRVEMRRKRRRTPLLVAGVAVTATAVAALYPGMRSQLAGRPSITQEP